MPITQESLGIAQMFAAEQPTLSKRRQVYLNTLAVCIVNSYMELMQIPTELKASDSWHPVLRLCGDMADLKLAELGHLECRPIKSIPLSEAVTVLCDLPEELPDERIGCMVVEIDEVRRRANLLGFAKIVSSGELLSNQLFHMDDFGEYLEELRAEKVKPSKELVNLRQWFQNIFEAAWQPAEALLDRNSGDLASGFRSASLSTSKSDLKRAKLIKISGKLVDESVVLVVVLNPLPPTTEIRIRVEVHATGVQSYLPPQLHIRLIDQAGIAVMVAQARSDNSSIQFEFRAEAGERFSVQLVLSDVDVIEDFVI